MSLKILTDDLNKLYDGGEKAVVDIVFVHGLRGHPQRTWEAAVDPDDPDDRIFWPAVLLPKSIKESRIFSFGYSTEFATFYPLLTTPVSHTNIDHHSTGLVLKLGNYRRETETTTRPIIFIAHSLGGLVVANALSLPPTSSTQTREVIDSTCGTIFLGTPFKGSDKAPWAEMARKLLSWAGDSNDQTIKDLDKRSKNLQEISIDFHLLLQARLANSSGDSKKGDGATLKPIQVACFFEEIGTSKTWFKIKKNLGLIVTEESATLAGYRPVGINADHVNMCRYASVDTAGYKLVVGKIKEMITNLKKSAEELASEGQTVVRIGDVHMGDNNLNIGGFIAGVVLGTTKDAVNMNVTNHFGAGSGIDKALDDFGKKGQK